ncbi:IclR family transcriptional regulator [soil metagenome]
MEPTEDGPELWPSGEFPIPLVEAGEGVPSGGTAVDGNTALDRALAILDYLATVRSATPSQVAAELALSRSTAYRVMERLRRKGYIDDAGTEGTWRLGPAVARMALSVIETSDVARVSPPYLRILVHQARESIGLGVPRGTDIVFIYRDAGPQSVAVNSEVGARRPMHCTAVGKAYLAALPPDERSALISSMRLTPKTSRTIWSPEALEKEIKEVIARGWSQDLMEFDDASTCCGAPVLDRTGRPVGAISISGVATRVTPLLPKLGALVVGTAEAISRNLGYTPQASLAVSVNGKRDRLDYA